MTRRGTASPSCRVLHILWSGRIGGIERQVEAIVRYAAQHRPGQHRACFLDGRGSVGDELVAAGFADRLELRTGWDPVGLWRLVRLLRARRPGVVHSQTHAVIPTLAVLLALPGVAFVYTEQSPRALRRSRKFQLLYWLLRRVASRFVALTPTMARAMEARGVARGRIVVIPNVFAVPRRGRAVPRPVASTVGIVARLEAQKRVDLLIGVVQELRQRGIACGGLVVGDGTSRAALVEQAARAGLRERIEFAGEQDDVVPWLDRMDVFLMTSAVEPFGITALESMARGVPVVAMPCPGGLSDLVTRGGLLLPDRDVATAADAVAALLESPARRAELRARGEETVADYSVEHVFPMLEAVCEDLLDPGRARLAERDET